MLTADTITDEQIRLDVLYPAFETGDRALVRIARIALADWYTNNEGEHNDGSEQRNARARCAEILNAREGK